MSLSNPNKPVTEQRLQEFYHKIEPYMGGGGGGSTYTAGDGIDISAQNVISLNPTFGFTPVGTIISVMGNAAPTNYLACNGQTVNIADYPELAAYFEVQFGTKNHFGGDGTTTFGICDLRGEFLRGTGTNSHAFSGNGASVGVHQNPTQLPGIWHEAANRVYMGTSNSFDSASNNFMYNDKDTYVKPGDIGGTIRKAQTISTTDRDDLHSDWVFGLTIRPTNTSVLFCIATKNIYLNPSLDYSTSEKIVGTWIDGKTIYQRTIPITTPSTQAQTSIDLQLSDIGAFYNICSDGSFLIADDSGLGVRVPLSCCWSHAQQSGVPDVYGIGSILVMRNGSLNIDFCTPHYWQNKSAYVTIQYTKTS